MISVFTVKNSNSCRNHVEKRRFVHSLHVSGWCNLRQVECEKKRGCRRSCEAEVWVNTTPLNHSNWGREQPHSTAAKVVMSLALIPLIADHPFVNWYVRQLNNSSGLHSGLIKPDIIRMGPLLKDEVRQLNNTHCAFVSTHLTKPFTHTGCLEQIRDILVPDRVCIA